MTDNIPYTTAASDFMKSIVFKEDEKTSLIDFTATDFITLRNRLIEYIKAVYPLDYDLFAESDLGMMFVELIAYMGSVMSMKTDMIAHEMFLKTVKSPANLRKIFEIIGVRLRGPGAASAKTRLTADATIGDSEFTVPAASRVFQANSTLDGQPVNYTLYSTTNGFIDNPTNTADLTFYKTDSEGDLGNEWNNAVLVEGSLAVDTGIFSDVDVLKEITLANSPVVDGSIQVFLSNAGDASGVYKEVNSLLSTSSSDLKVFQTVYTDDFQATLQFGDGVTGVLPPNNSSYIITYRVGGGQRGNGPTNAVNGNFTTQEGSGVSLTNTNPFTGGTEAETIDHAKKYAKLVYRQQDRLVSLDDYVTFANIYRDTQGQRVKATATTRKAFSSANVIDVYLLQRASPTQLQKASLSFKEAMLKAMENKKMMTDEIVLVDGLIRTVDLDVRITMDERFEPNETDIKSRVARAINGYFNVDKRDFGEDFLPSDVSREIFTSVDEVRIAEITNFNEKVSLDINEIIQLNNFTITVNYV